MDIVDEAMTGKVVSSPSTKHQSLWVVSDIVKLFVRGVRLREVELDMA